MWKISEANCKKRKKCAKSGLGQVNMKKSLRLYATKNKKENRRKISRNGKGEPIMFPMNSCNNSTIAMNYKQSIFLQQSFLHSMVLI
jgi:hypothetical protein